MNTIGIDIGSITTKAALVSDGALVETALIFTGYCAGDAGVRVYEEILKKASIESSSVNEVVSTGYGRNSVKFADKAVTEITCHGAGARFLNAEVRTVIDVGGQDSKAVALDKDGRVKEFVMNDKCAAGTGRFLEVMARALELDLDRLGAISLLAERPSEISSICTVFAESEVISLISKGESRENIVAGIHDSAASRIAALVRRIELTEPVMMTGGVAKNSGAVRALEKKLNVKLLISGYSQLTGAIGAAIIASSLNLR